MVILLLLLIPLAASGLTAVTRSRRTMESIHLLSALAGFGMAILLAADVLAHGDSSAWGGFLYADSLSALVVVLAAFVYLACAPYAIGYLRHDERNQVFGPEENAGISLVKLRKYYTLTPLLAFSMFLVAMASNLGVMWVALEGTTLASIFLVTFYDRPTSLEAAWKYAMIGGVGLSMALFGTILTYYEVHQALGTESLSALSWQVITGNAARFDPTVMRLAFILVLLGYGTKAGLAPMHTWKPDAYSEAPRAGGGAAGRGGSQFRHLCSGALLCGHRTLPWSVVPFTAPDAVRSAVDRHRGSVHPGAAQLPEASGVFQHRSWRNHGAGTWVWRGAWSVGDDAPHDLSLGDQTAAVLLRG